MPIKNSPMLKAARSLYAASRPHTPTSVELLLARQMHRKGCTLKEVHQALGWNCTWQTTQRRLAKVSLKFDLAFEQRAKAYLSPAHESTNMSRYRPKDMKS